MSLQSTSLRRLYALHHRSLHSPVCPWSRWYQNGSLVPDKSVAALSSFVQRVSGSTLPLPIRSLGSLEAFTKPISGAVNVQSDNFVGTRFIPYLRFSTSIHSEILDSNISSNSTEVKETFAAGKQESAESSGTSDKDGADVKGDDSKASSSTGKENSSSYNSQTFFGKFRSSIPSAKVYSAFHRLKEAKVTDFVKKGCDIVKDEIYGNPNQRKRLEYTPAPSFKGETSERRDVTVLPSKQSRWNKTWGAFREKMQGHPIFKRFTVFSEPVVVKTQELAEDVRERWETSDNPVVHKIQDVSDTIFQETDSAATIKEISRRDPSFSLMEFVAEVQEAVRPVLNAYIKGDVETLKKYCTPEVITRCEAEHKAFQSHGIFFDNKILHISDVELRETKMMGTSPIIILAFQTQQVHCVRDRNGAITEGGKDTIHTIYYAWGMQQIDPEEVGEGAIYPIWKLREIQQLGIQSLI